MLSLGVYLNDIEAIPNWKLRILREILAHPDLCLTTVYRFETSCRHKFRPGRWWEPCFEMEMKLERQLFGIESGEKVPDNLLDGTEIVALENDGQGLSGAFGPDLIISLELDLPPELLVVKSRLGVLSLQLGEKAYKHEHHVGFWEVLHRQAGVRARLITSGSEFGAQSVIDEAFFNRSFSISKCRVMALEGAVSLMVKAVRRLASGELPAGRDAGPDSVQQHAALPRGRHFLYYLFQFYSGLFVKLLHRLNYRLRSSRYFCWTLFFGEGDFLDYDTCRTDVVFPCKGEEWADPFLYKQNDDQYVFFESIDHRSQMGKISCGRLLGHELSDIRDVLVKPYHLSYPNIFEDQGELYLMPETSGNKRLEIYRCKRFPDSWELYVTAFQGELLFDSSFFDDEFGQKWLFTNKQTDPNSPVDSELYIYKVDSLKLNSIIPHPQNPVITDSRVARNAGRIFSFNGEFYRPSQRNEDGIYGKALNLNRIVRLDLEEYSEELVRVFYPASNRGLLATHHLHQSEGSFVIDAAFKYLR